MDLVEEKKACRADLLEVRAAVPAPERARQSLLLGQNVAALLDARKLPDRCKVAVFASMPEEVDLAPLCALLYGMGATVAFPCVHSRDRMEFYALTAADLDATPPAFFTDPKRCYPEEDCTAYERIAPEELDLILVPGLGFDRDRRRIGYGWGCYDRYLARVPESCLKVGVCFDDQLVERLPAGDDDLPVDVVVSPTVAY